MKMRSMVNTTHLHLLSKYYTPSKSHCQVKSQVKNHASDNNPPDFSNKNESCD